MLTISRGLKLKIVSFLAALLTIGAVGIYWYFAFHIKTPKYAISQIEDALKTHSEKKFARFVDVDMIADTATDAVAAGLLDDGRTLKDETRTAVLDFVKIFRQPLRQSIEKMIYRYVRTGSFSGDDNADKVLIDSQMLLRRTGIADAKYHSLKGLEEKKDSNGNKYAICFLVVQPNEANDAFTLNLRLEPGIDGIYRLTQFENLADFFAIAAKKRREAFINYLKKSDDINENYDKNIAKIEEKIRLILSTGNLSEQSTRNEIKKVTEEELMREWQAKKSELEALAVPDEAQSLHRLYLKICDDNLSYAINYATWLTDKQAATIHSALTKQKEARTLLSEAIKIRQQIEANEGI